MKVRTTLLLLILALALGGAVWWMENHLPSTRERERLRHAALGLRASKLDGLEIVGQQKELLLGLQRRAGQWWLSRPIEDLADPRLVEQLLNELDQIGWLQSLEPAEFEDPALWRRTGLDSPSYWLDLQLEGRSALRLGVAAAAAIEGCHYLRLERAGKSSYHVVKSALPNLLKPPAPQWRDPKLVRASLDRLRAITLERAEGRMELRRNAEDAALWEMVTPLRSRLGKEAMDGLLSTLMNLNIDEVLPASEAVSAGRPSAGDLRVQLQFQDQLPGMTFSLARANAEGQQALARCDWRKLEAKVSSKTLSQLWLEPNDLRDRLLCHVRADELTELRIESADRPKIELSRKGDSWFMQRHGRRISANAARVSALFDALNDYEVQAFASDAPASLKPYGLQPPLVSLSWRSQGINEPVQLQIGVGQSEGFFARYADAPSVFRVDASLLPFIAEEPIKWKGLALLRFSTFALRRIALGAGSAPPVVLHYDPISAQWKGQRAGRDITALLDRVKADALASSLAKLNVQDWVGDGRNAVEQLSHPALRLEVDLGEAGTNKPADRKWVIELSPSAPGNFKSALYYGRISGDPDLFYLSRETVSTLLTPVLRTE